MATWEVLMIDVDDYDAATSVGVNFYKTLGNPPSGVPPIKYWNNRSGATLSANKAALASANIPYSVYADPEAALADTGLVRTENAE